MKPTQANPGVIRIALAATLVIALAALALQLGRVDGAFGEPTGPERLMAAIDGARQVPDSAATSAHQALRDRPIDGRAYRVLAQVAQADGHRQQAERLYVIAAERWPRDRIARAELADRAFAAGDIDLGLTHLDALMRVAPALRAPVLTNLMPHLVEPALRSGLIERLAMDPPWRGALARAVLDESTPVEHAQTLLAELDAQAALTEAELQTRVTLLERAGRPAKARDVWLRALPTDGNDTAGLVFDGGFEHPGIRGGYGWQFNPPPGVAIGFDPANALAGDFALSIVFNGRAVRFAHVRQTLALAPGQYRLRSASSNGVTTARPFEWRVSCTGDGRQLARLQLGGSSGWQHSGTAFEVPADCPGQQLQLRHLGRSLAERQPRGMLQLDEISITALR